MISTLRKSEKAKLFSNMENTIHYDKILKESNLHSALKIYCRTRDFKNPIWGHEFNYFEPLTPHPDYECQGLEECFFEEYNGPRTSQVHYTRKPKEDIDFLCACARRFDTLICKLAPYLDLLFEFELWPQHYKIIRDYQEFVNQPYWEVHSKVESSKKNKTKLPRKVRTQGFKSDRKGRTRSLSEARDQKLDAFYQDFSSQYDYLDRNSIRSNAMARELDCYCKHCEICPERVISNGDITLCENIANGECGEDGIGNFDGKYECHALYDDLRTTNENALNYYVSNYVSKSINNLENLIFLISALRSSTNVTNALSVIALYTKTHFNISLTESMYRVCQDFLIDDSYTPHAGSGEGGDGSTITDCLTAACTNWKHVVSSPLFHHISQVVCVIISIGFLPEILKQGRFSLQGLKFFKSKVGKLQKDSTTFYEAVFESAIYFIKGGYQAFLSGNLTHYFFSADEVSECEKLYNTVVAAEPLLEADKLYLLGEQGIEGVTCEAEYNKVLLDLIDRFQTLQTTTEDKYLRNIYNGKLLKLRSISFALRTAQSNVKFKKRPFAVMISGASSIGKSTLNSILITTILQANNLPLGDEYRCVINEMDKYDTEIKAYTKVITLDDWANLRPEKCEESPTRRIIDFINNVAKMAVKAELADKGVVLVNPDLITLTTNVRDLSCRAWSAEPASIMRRFDYIVEPTLKPSHCNSLGGLSDSAIVRDPSAWLFDVYEVEIIKVPNPGPLRIPDDFRFRTILKRCEIHELCDFMKDKSRQHFKKQEILVRRYHTQINAVCEKCNYCNAICRCSLSIEEMQSIEQVYVPPITSESSVGEYENQAAPFHRPLTQIRRIRLGYQLLSKAVIIYHYILYLWLIISHYFNACASSVYGVWINRMHSPDLPSVIRKRLAEERDRILMAKYNMLANKLHAESSILSAYLRNQQKLLQRALGIVGCMVVTYGAAWFIKTKFLNRSIDSEAQATKEMFSFTNDARPNCWLNPTFHAVPKPLSSVGATPEQLMEKIIKHLYILKVYADHTKVDGVVSNCFPLRQNIWLVPKHMMTDPDATYHIDLTFSRNGDDIHPRFSCELLPEDRFYIPGQDLCMVQIKSAGDQPDLAAHFALAPTAKRDYCYNMVYLDPSASTRVVRKQEIRATTSPSHLTSLTKDHRGTNISQFGCCYEGEHLTQKGMCMAVVTTMTNSSTIIGFHASGVTGTAKGFFVTMCYNNLEAGFDYFNSRGLVVHSSGILDTSPYGLDLDISPTIHRKHPLQFIDNVDLNGTINYPSAEIYGSHSLGRANPFTSVARTFISMDVEMIPELQSIYTIPINKDLKKHWHKDINLRLKTSVNIPAAILKAASEDLFRYVASLRVTYNNVAVLPHDAILAGMDGVYGIDAVNLNSSLGFPLNKPKRNVLTPSTRIVPGISRPLDIPDWLMDDIIAKEENYKRGLRNYPLFRTTLKDEAVKIGRDKRRLFEAAPFWYVYLMRKYTLGICAHIMRHRLDYCTAVGLNVHSYEWTDLADHLNYFGANKYIAGDYKAFDKNMPSTVILMACRCITKIAEMSGNYKSEDLYVMQGIFTDLIYPTIEFDTVILKVFNSHCSGNSLTVIINNFANLLYMRCAYYDLYNLMPPTDFHNRIRLVVYGDDNVAEVSVNETVFNHTSCSASLAKFGITYTMADKESESVPYISLDQVDFLKRRFIWLEELGIVVAPLELQSIAKSLHFRVITKNCDMGPRQIMADILQNAFIEIWYHGQEIYEQVATELYGVVEIHNLQTLVGNFRSYNDIKDRLSAKFQFGQIENPELSVDQYEIHSLSTTLSSRRITGGVIILPNNYTSLFWTYKDVLSCYFECTMSYYYYPNEIWCLNDTKSIEFSKLDAKMLDGTFEPMSDNYELHSMREEVVPVQADEHDQTLEVRDAEPGDMAMVSTKMEGTQYTIGHRMTDIGNFLSRPVRVFRIVFPDDVYVSTSFNPWAEFLDHPAVKQKTANYAYIRGRLRLKFEITGSPFRSGKIMVSYAPCTLTGTNTDIDRSGATQYYKITYSQRMKTFLNTTNGQGSEMLLPFMYYRDYLSVIDTLEHSNMGVIVLQSLSALTSLVSGNRMQVTLTVLAYMENVELVGPTNYVVQSGYETGPISKPASVIAGAAQGLASIPTISPYMRATAITAGAIAKVAALFGFSRPNNLTVEHHMKPVPISNLANHNAEDSLYKLTADVKQELTVDPRTVDLGDKDEMAILNIVQIESYITSFPWNPIDVAGYQVFTINVTPVVFDFDPASEPVQAIFQTACCTVSQTFKYWRGGMKYRFIANTSSLQRGRLKITYEPAVPAVGEPEENTNYTYIMDLAETDDFEVCVHWCQDRHYLECAPMNAGTIPFNSTLPVPYPIGFANGNITVHVLNELNSPGDRTVGTVISVFVSMCDDADFAVPTLDKVQDLVLYVPQSGHDSLGLNLHSDKPSRAAVKVDFGEKIYDPNQNMVYFGEKISSIRAMMKRYVHVMTESQYRNSDPFRRFISRFIKWRLIAYRGVDPNGVNLTTDGRYNFANWTYVHWYRLAFAGERGGIRLKAVKLSVNTNSNPLHTLSIARADENERVGFASTAQLELSNPSLTSSSYERFYQHSSRGLALTTLPIKNGLEVELPDYSGKRYTSTSRAFATTSNDQNFILTYELNASASGYPESISYFIASAEDYSLFYWLGFPPVGIQGDYTPVAGDPYPLPGPP